MTSDGKLEYKVIRPIQEGAMITFSYLEIVFQKSTPERRELLKQSKDFVCRCPRCLMPDILRLAKCLTCCGYAQCSYDSEEVESWTGDECGVLAAATSRGIQRKEDAWSQRLNDLKMRIMFDCTTVNASGALEGLRAIANDLSPKHHLFLRALTIIAKLAASQAINLENSIAMLPPFMRTGCFRQFGNPTNLRYQAGSLGLELALKVECIAARCTKKDCGTFRHPRMHSAVYDSTQTVFFGCQDLLKATGKAWPVPDMIQDYIPFMQLMWGKDDQDVSDIELALKKQPPTVSESSSNGCTTQTSSKIQKQNSNRRRTNKKKKGRRK